MAKKKHPDEVAYRNLCNNMREVTKSTAGKEIIWSILAMCGLYSESFTGNSQTFYMEGKRAVGLEILQVMEDADKTLYARLLLEAQKGKNASPEM